MLKSCWSCLSLPVELGHSTYRALGEGGMGMSIARDEKLGRDVVSSLLGTRRDRRTARTIIREAKAAALSTTNIATIYEIDEAAGLTVSRWAHRRRKAQRSVNRGRSPSGRPSRSASTREDWTTHTRAHRQSRLEPANVMFSNGRARSSTSVSRSSGAQGSRDGGGNGDEGRGADRKRFLDVRASPEPGCRSRRISSASA